jgi:tRNA U38,U39,U40 pseudouridine synthase TruA
MPQECECGFCKAVFPSRNAMFRHIRGDCPAADEEGIVQQPQRQRVAFLFGYFHPHHPRRTDDDTDADADHDHDAIASVSPEESGAILWRAFQEALEEQQQHQHRHQHQQKASLKNSTTTATASASATSTDVKLLRYTQSTVPRSRPDALGLELDCPASEDVLVVAFLAPPARDRLDQVLVTTRKLLASTGVTLHAAKVLSSSGSSGSGSSSSSSSGKNLHAEQSCTQHVFHYLVPLEWLPDAQDVLSWYQENKQNSPQQQQSGNNTTNNNTKKNNIKRTAIFPATTPAPPSIGLIKQALRSAESDTVKRKACDGRFKALAHKEKRPWHNYADPQLIRGVQASPSNEVVWRALDRARFCGFVSSRIDSTTSVSHCHQEDKDDKQENIFIVYEFCGDEFLKQQVRRIMGAAIAMAHEWLPHDYITATTSKRSIVETPLAPPEYLYRAASRFHFDEMAVQGRRIFDESTSCSDDNNNVDQEDVQEVALYKFTNDTVRWMQGKLMADSTTCKGSSIRTRRREMDSSDNGLAPWLTELRDVVAPRIRAQLRQTQEDNTRHQGATHSHRSEADDDESSISTTTDTATIPEAAPGEYHQVLQLLQKIVETNRWPSTSVARSTVISNDPAVNDGTVEPTQQQAGSFTVANREFCNENDNIPLANSLFPDLVDAVFELEARLANNNNHNNAEEGGGGGNVVQTVEEDENGLVSTTTKTPRERKTTSRPPSSHCAINCNAQFLPHVDSGRGLGQSLSMIVGLGDYHRTGGGGGELMVEGVSHDIRYRPLEFDGWNMRHWTRPFSGQRFSLVWFTPEGNA